MAKILSIEPYRGIHHRITFTDIRPSDIRFRNFSGKGSKYNRDGMRNFKLVIDPESVDALRDIGAYVPERPNSRPGGEPTYQVKVNVSYMYSDPAIILFSGDNKIRITEDTVNQLDSIEVVDIPHLVVTTSNNTFNDTKLCNLSELGIEKRYSMFLDEYRDLERGRSNDDYPVDEEDPPF